jgi:hypothetical protein
MPPRSSEFDQEMAQLEAEIKRLEAEYNMFFAGRLPRLPWETRARVEKMVKRYDRMPLKNTAQRFRFDSVQARFVKFCELWERNLKSKEEGRQIRGHRPLATDTPARPNDAAQKNADGAQARVVHVAAIKDPARESDQLKALYDQLSKARQEAGAQPLPFKQFAAVVKAQVSKLGGDKASVKFRVAVQDGKVTLAARADKE